MTGAADADEVIGGWPVSELLRLAENIAWRWRGVLPDHAEAADIAFVGMVECCLAGIPTNDKNLLYWAGRRAVEDAHEKEVRYKGLPYHPVDNHREHRKLFVAYWSSANYDGGEFEEKLVDSMSVHQVWSALPERHRDVLSALVSAGTYQGAAALMDVGLSTWTTRLARARYEARRLWHAPETPPQHWAKEKLTRHRGERATARLTLQRKLRKAGAE